MQADGCPRSLTFLLRSLRRQNRCGEKGAPSARGRNGAGGGVAVKQRETSGAPHPRPDARPCRLQGVGLGAHASFRSGRQRRTREGSPVWHWLRGAPSVRARGSLPASRPGMQHPGSCRWRPPSRASPCSTEARAPVMETHEGGDTWVHPRVQPSRRATAPGRPCSPPPPIAIALLLSPETRNLRSRDFRPFSSNNY